MLIFIQIRINEWIALKLEFYFTCLRAFKTGSRCCWRACLIANICIKTQETLMRQTKQFRYIYKGSAYSLHLPSNYHHAYFISSSDWNSLYDHFQICVMLNWTDHWKQWHNSRNRLFRNFPSVRFCLEPFDKCDACSFCSLYWSTS